MTLTDYHRELLELRAGDVDGAFALFVRAYRAGLWPPPESLGGGEALLQVAAEPRELAARITAYVAGERPGGVVVLDDEPAERAADYRRLLDEQPPKR